MTPAPALALTASLLIGVTTILLQDCVRRTNPILTMLVVTLAGTIVFMAFALPTVAWDDLTSPAVAFFALALVSVTGFAQNREVQQSNLYKHYQMKYIFANKYNDAVAAKDAL